MVPNFQEWFASQGPWNRQDAQQKLEHTWRVLTSNGLSCEMAASCLDEVVTVMRNEYGE